MKTFTTTIATRLPIPPHPFQIASLDELGLWLLGVEEGALLLLVTELRGDTEAVGKVAVFLFVVEPREEIAVVEPAVVFVVGGLSEDTPAGEVPELGLLKVSGMQLNAPPQ
jgi:hypothetical protein